MGVSSGLFGLIAQWTQSMGVEEREMDIILFAMYCGFLLWLAKQTVRVVVRVARKVVK